MQNKREPYQKGNTQTKTKQRTEPNARRKQRRLNGHKRQTQTKEN